MLQFCVITYKTGNNTELQHNSDLYLHYTETPPPFLRKPKYTAELTIRKSDSNAREFKLINSPTVNVGKHSINVAHEHKTTKRGICNIPS
jgi:hypothetical protein